VAISGVGRRVYHRLESPTQSLLDAARQQASGEIWGRAPRGSDIPKVKAYPGPLPAGRRGIEFITEAAPDDGCHPKRPEWSGPRSGVVVVGDSAMIQVVITKNTQT
jgi:hypothetical protein